MVICPPESTDVHLFLPRVAVLFCCTDAVRGRAPGTRRPNQRAVATLKGDDSGVSLGAGDGARHAGKLPLTQHLYIAAPLAREADGFTDRLLGGFLLGTVEGCPVLKVDQGRF